MTAVSFEVIMKKVIKVDKEEIRFKIDQLRKDKMIYALESIAVTFIIELSYIFVLIITGKSFSVLFAILGLIVSVSYFLYMSYGNYKRFIEIKQLEKRL